jgi:hypothetical protein
MTPIEKQKRAKRRSQIPFTREWLMLRPDLDVAYMASLAEQRLARPGPKLPYEEKAKLERMVDEGRRRREALNALPLAS